VRCTVKGTGVQNQLVAYSGQSLTGIKVHGGRQGGNWSNNSCRDPLLHSKLFEILGELALMAPRRQDLNLLVRSFAPSSSFKWKYDLCIYLGRWFINSSLRRGKIR